MKGLVLGALVLVGLGGAAWVDPGRARLVWQVATGPVAPPAVPAEAGLAFPSEAAERLVRAAERQVGVTLSYDPAYVTLAFPGGDVPAETGVCSDVLIRAMRAGLGIDLQLAVNQDMKRNFAAYPKIWGLKRPDRNIDHRRVPNLETFLSRLGAERELSRDPAAFLPGDIVTWRLPGNLPHVGIITDHPGADGVTPMIVHNVGAGARVEDRLFEWELTAHYRLSQPVLERLGGGGSL